MKLMQGEDGGREEGGARLALPLLQSRPNPDSSLARSHWLAR